MPGTFRPSGSPLSAARRLRRQLFGASTAAMGTLSALLAIWMLSSGAAPADLVTPLTGAALALAAELLCVDVAVRRAERAMESEHASEGIDRSDAVGA